MKFTIEVVKTNLNDLSVADISLRLVRLCVEMVGWTMLFFALLSLSRWW